MHGTFISRNNIAFVFKFAKKKSTLKKDVVCGSKVSFAVEMKTFLGEKKSLKFFFDVYVRIFPLLHTTSY